MARGWSLKWLHREIVLSAAYQQISDFGFRIADSKPKPPDNPQSAIHNPQLIDPANRLLWRMNRRRLEAESLRDFMLAVSGEFKRLAVLSSVSILCVYLTICLGALKLRYTRTREPGAFRAPGGPTVGILGSVVVIWLLSHSTKVEVGALAGTLTMAITYYFARRWFLNRRGEEIN